MIVLLVTIILMLMIIPTRLHGHRYYAYHNQSSFLWLYHDDHDQAAYLRTLAVLRAPPYLPRPPSFAQTQGFIQIMISHDGDDDGNQLWR